MMMVKKSDTQDSSVPYFQAASAYVKGLNKAGWVLAYSENGIPTIEKRVHMRNAENVAGALDKEVTGHVQNARQHGFDVSTDFKLRNIVVLEVSGEAKWDLVDTAIISVFKPSQCNVAEFIEQFQRLTGYAVAMPMAVPANDENSSDPSIMPQLH